jgi:hypothetical protein
MQYSLPNQAEANKASHYDNIDKHHNEHHHYSNFDNVGDNVAQHYNNTDDAAAGYSVCFHP